MLLSLLLLHHHYHVLIKHLIMLLTNQASHTILIRPSLPSATHFLLLDKEVLLQHLVLHMSIVRSPPQNHIWSMLVKYLLHLLPFIYLHQ